MAKKLGGGDPDATVIFRKGNEPCRSASSSSRCTSPVMPAGVYTAAPNHN